MWDIARKYAVQWDMSVSEAYDILFYDEDEEGTPIPTPFDDPTYDTRTWDFEEIMEAISALVDDYGYKYAEVDKMSNGDVMRHYHLCSEVSA